MSRARHPSARRPPRRLRRQAVVVAVSFSLSGVAAASAAGADPNPALNGAVALSHAAPPATPGPPPAAAAAPGPAATSTPTRAPVPDPAHLPLAAPPATSQPPAAPAGPNAPPPVAAQQPQTATGHQKAAPSATGAPFGSPAAKPAATTPKAKPTAKAAASPFRAASGVPLASDPTLSLAALGPVALGVPNFFIDKFRIPPFLIPIYEAAGIQYGVPWQALAAINEIETDYGRNLGVSSAGAIGWMQMLPATWQQYGVDANNDGVKDPYNPQDAIFAAARFLRAAGAEQNLRGALYAWSPAPWYVDSVLLRARLIGGLPADLLSSLTGLTDGTFPVGAASTYADDVAEAASLARRRTPSTTAAASAPEAAVKIYSRVGAPVVAVKDGVIADVGESAALGKYVALRDAAGNTYTYSGLKIVPALYAVPKAPSPASVPATRYAPLPSDPAPQSPATAGHQTTPPLPAVAALTAPRLLATGTPAASGAAPRIDAFTHTYGLPRAEADLKPLIAGARVNAGAILGRVGVTDPTGAPHLRFQIRPAGVGSPLIDPKPILDGWKLLESTSAYRAAALAPLVGPGASNPSIGQLLLESKSQLEQQVLADPSIDIYPCGRTAVQSGLVDQRALAPLALLSAAGLKPTVSGLPCPGSLPSAASPAEAAGTGFAISKINGTPVLGHQGVGSVTDAAIRRLLTLQGSFRPDEIISLLSYPTANNTLALSDHANRLEVGFNPPDDPAAKPAQPARGPLTPKQWQQLIARIGQIANPTVAAQPSSAAIPAKPGP